MPRVTIKDIAAAAGVSSATVDRVLNGRAGVRAANRQRVLLAARDLGYLPTDGMIPLPSRPAKLEFFIPTAQNAYLTEIASEIEGFSAMLPLVGSCVIHHISSIQPDAFLAAVEAVEPDTDGVGLVIIDHPRTRDLIEGLTQSGVRVVTIASDVSASSRSDYVGADNHMAGRTAARLVGLSEGRFGGDVALFLGSHSYEGHRERAIGFQEAMAQLFPKLTLLEPIETDENDDKSYATMTKLLRTNPRLVSAYCVGGGRAGIAKAIHDARPAAKPFTVLHDLCDDTARWLENGSVDAIIDQNAKLIAEQSVIRLLGAIAVSTPTLPVQHIEPRILLKENMYAGTAPRD